MTLEENIKAILETIFSGYKEELIDVAVKNICNLKTKPKTGQVGYWNKDFICSICGCKVYPVDIDNGSFNYCPNCGAKMYEKEE